MSELEVFGSLENTEAAAPVAPAATDAADARKAKLEAMKASLRQTMHEDPSYAKRLHSLSDKIEVVNSLGFGDSGNIVVDRAKSTKDERALTTTSVIVGYRVRNIGDTPITYQTEVYTQNAEGKFVGEKVEKVIAPGATADLTRQYMTMLCAIPEISFTLANGKVIRGSGKSSAKGDVKAELEAYYFSFDKNLGRQINADEVKLNVGEKVGDKWQVKAEFVEAFGYLNNAPERTRGARKADGPKITSSDLAANFVMQMLKDSAL